MAHIRQITSLDKSIESKHSEQITDVQTAQVITAEERSSWAASTDIILTLQLLALVTYELIATEFSSEVKVRKAA